MKLVFIQKGRIITDSLTLAEAFEKDHRNVFRDIEVQIEKLKEAGMSEWGLLNFEHTQYQHPQNKQMYPKYNLTEDAFALVAMSYVTPKAMVMKIKFIDEFKRMKHMLESPNEIEKFLYNPDTIIRIAQNWKEEKELRLLAEAKIEADKPKVLFAESLQVSDDTINVNDLAKLLKQNGVDIGEKRLFQWLRENGYLIKSGSEYNMPTQRSMELRLFEVKIGTRQSSDGTPRITRTPKVTGRGQMYFLNKFKRIGDTA